MELRAHQETAIQKVRGSISDGHKRPILFAPCSFGKTICAASIASMAGQKGNKSLFVVHRRLLAIQTKEKFDQYGVHCSIIMSGYDTDFSALVMITTHQTYSRRLMLANPEINKFFHDAKVIFVDECHFGISPSYKKIYKYYEDRVIIGLTGSPARGDQRGLGEVFDDLVESAGIQDLTDQGFLAPIRYFAPSKIDLSKVPMLGGDFNRKALQKEMNTVKLNGDVLSNWLKQSEGRQTIVFTTGVKHSKALQIEFQNHGVSAAHLDAHSSDQEREAVLRKFRDGEITVVTNCQLFTEGYDADFVSCIVLARGTKSYPLYVQMCGRGQRTYPGKKDCILLDHGGNIDRFGFISDPVEWTLDGKEIAWKKPKRDKKDPKPIECEMCSHVFQAKPRCPNCGHELKDYGKRVAALDVDLVEVSKNKTKKREYTMSEKRDWWAQFEYERRRLGKSESWLRAQYRSKFGVWYRGMDDVAPKEPSLEVSNWLKYQRIKFAKSKKRQEATA